MSVRNHQSWRRWLPRFGLLCAALWSSSAQAFLVNEWAPIETGSKQIEPLRQVQPGRSFVEPMTGMRMIWLPGGCFPMGSPPRIESRDADEGAVRSVCVDGVWLAQSEMTQGQWLSVMRHNPAANRLGEDYPVERVAWDDVELMLKQLNAHYKGVLTFRLPSEAEWEFACRNGGQNIRYAGGSSPEQFAWYAGNSGGRTQRVGSLHPNRLGFVDMSGSVWEWTRDAYDAMAYAKLGGSSPVAQGLTPYRAIRGGAFDSPAKQTRCANRGFERFSVRSPAIGLRLAAVLDNRVEKKVLGVGDLPF
ncbi:formylglycine-generating enzyme family protein [Magnetofaba australis]|uniref:Sulfatase-modifying factor enzyme-like domain-containing protein n=1 Tax=Magnetofaba australis IT-1 TaxID=1434232 RepID=A0A1Y2K3R5_9PROT|nr:formylglycine-generating enzyme family protein [Magnetofaba australis]OSM02317.1 hypothetical protein MAIT1_02441 [Magnetofaba australis IT-1]